MGQFDKYTVDDLREIVEHDRPHTMHQQALAWRSVSELLAGQAEDLRAEAGAVAGCWSGRAASGYQGELGRAETAMRVAVSTAADNAHGWAEIADIVGWARDEVLRIHAEWCAVKAMPTQAPDPRYVPPGVAVVVGEPRDLDRMREPFDQAARAVMDMAAQLIQERHERYLTVPSRYRPPPESALPIDPASGQTAPGGESETEDDPFFGTGGPHVSPVLQGSGSVHPSMGGIGSAPAGAPSATGTSPMLASAPMRPVAGDGTNGRTGPRAWGDGDEARGPRFSRAPKPYTGESTSHSLADPTGKRTEPVDSEIERLGRRPADTDADDPWRPSEPTVPGVITGGEPSEPPFHDPGTVIGGR